MAVARSAWYWAFVFALIRAESSIPATVLGIGLGAVLIARTLLVLVFGRDLVSIVARQFSPFQDETEDELFSLCNMRKCILALPCCTGPSALTRVAAGIDAGAETELALDGILAARSTQSKSQLRQSDRGSTMSSRSNDFTNARGSALENNPQRDMFTPRSIRSDEPPSSLHTMKDDEAGFGAESSTKPSLP